MENLHYLGIHEGKKFYKPIPSQRYIATGWTVSLTTLSANDRNLVNMFLTFAFCLHVYLERTFVSLSI